MFVSEIRATNESDAESSLSITTALTWPDGENWWEVRLLLVWLSACLTNSGWYKADVDTGALQTGEREACVERTSLKPAINSWGGIYSDSDPLLYFRPPDILYFIWSVPMQVSFQVADKTEPSSCKFFLEECIVWTHLKNSERTWDDRS